MWELSNQTPYAAERAWVRDKNGAEVWLVAVKGAFHIQPDGETQLSDEQEEVFLAPRYLPDNTLYCESDLIHTKPATDVLLHGHAYAPGGAPAARVDVSMKVGSVSKSLRVSGDRTWERFLAGLSVHLTQSEPFVKMPLTYARAFGGEDCCSEDSAKHKREDRNPAGTGFATAPEHLVGKKAPNIEHPAHPISSWRHHPEPAGFGPIMSHWTPRVHLAGTYDETWEKERQPLYPEDFDEQFYNSAPLDQQVPGYLKGGEEVVLENLTPDGQLRFRLPRISLGFTTYFSGKSQHHQGRLHTVLLEPDVPRVVLCWHTHLPCHAQAMNLRKTRIYEKKRLRTGRAS